VAGSAGLLGLYSGRAPNRPSLGRCVVQCGLKVYSGFLLFCGGLGAVSGEKFELTSHNPNFSIKVEGPVPVRVMIRTDEILPCLSW
jgi:hypothetical protein